MSSLPVLAQILSYRTKILATCLSIEAAGIETHWLDLSTEPWKKYEASDYDSPELYCRSCLIDLNNPSYQDRDAKKCYFPMAAPRKKRVLYLEALRIAEKFLIDPKNEYFFGDRTIRIQAANSLISRLKLFNQAIDPALLELSQSE